MSTRTRIVRWLPRIAVTLAICIAVSLVYFLKQWLGEENAPAKKMAQQITLLTPPPPPPPPKEEEPPPPEIEEKVEIPEEQPEPEPMPEQSEAPPGEDLGVDAEGGAGGDEFGLVGKQGGRALLGGSGGSTEAWYKRALGMELQSLINEEEALRTTNVARVKLKLWIDEGRVQRVELLSSTGDKEWDRQLKRVVMGSHLQTPMPAGVEQPVHLQISSRL